MRPNSRPLGRQLASAALRYQAIVCEWGRNPPCCGFPNRFRKPAGNRIFLGRSDTIPSDDGMVAVEALLFLSRQPQTSRKLAEMARLADGTKARTLVRTLNRRYDAEGSAFRVEEVAGGFQLMTRSKFAPWLQRLHSAPAEIRLSPSAMEALAVVAYRQPVLRTEIEAIRGVQSGEVLRQLIERDLVRIAGRSGELGRPFLYGTTKRFLQLFGLRHLDELPQAMALRPREAIVTEQPGALAGPHSNNLIESNPSLVSEEEENVKTLITTNRRQAVAQDKSITASKPDHEKRLRSAVIVDQDEDEDDFDDEDEDDLEDEEDFDEEFEEEEEEEEDDEDEDEDLDDEPWEEVEDDDEEDWDEDEDEDWEDEDWDEDEEEWDEDDEEEEEEEEGDEA
jgi:segregation and condensation protein B